MAGNKNLQLIQALRGIASLLVVLLHATANASEILQTNFLFDFFTFGGAGVDIFFVLSGFIITYTCYKGLSNANNLPAFLNRRFIRIFPTYWIIISLLLLAQILLPSFYRTHYPFDFKNILSTYLLLPGHIMVNGVSWTLTNELFFYLLFCIAYIIPSKKWALYFAIAYSGILILLPLLGYNYKSENTWTGLITFPMNVEFFMGVVAAILIPRLGGKTSIPFIIFGSVAFLLSAIITNLDYQVIPNGFNRVVLFGIPSFFIITGLVKYELNKKIYIPKPFLDLGNASYSLYLLHLPLIAATCKIIVICKINNYFLLQLLLLITICIICYASIVFYKLIEKPVIAKLHSIRRINVAGEI